MTTFQAFADEISNHVQIGINSSFSPEYGVGQVAAVQLGVEQLGLTLSVIPRGASVDSARESLRAADVILLDDLTDPSAFVKLIGELPGSPVVLLRHEKQVEGFLALAV